MTGRGRADRPIPAPVPPAGGRWDAPVLVVLTLACLLPFAGAAFRADDPLFVWSARHLAAHPADPYGFQVNWSGVTDAVARVLREPPLSACFTAVAGTLLGWREAPLHLAHALPAVLAVLGAWALARRLTRRPLLAGLVLLLTPAFLVCATTVTSAVPMLAALTWAAAWWVRGTDERRAWPLALAAAAMALAVLTRTDAAVFLPALALHAWLRRGPGPWLLWFLVPAAALAGYQAFSLAAYGTGGIALAPGDEWAGRAVGQLALGFCFLGATFLPLALSAGMSARPRVFGVGLVSIVIGTLGLGSNLVRARDASTWILPVHFGVFAAVGLGLLYLVGADAARRREPASALLAAWVAGGFAFATFLSPAVSVASLLPLGPALAVLVARHADDHPGRGARFPVAVAGVLLVSAAIALAVAQSDTALGDSARRGAAEVRARAHGARIVFQGHGGFQYYAQEAGGVPLERGSRALEAGDLLVTPANAPQTLELESAMPREPALELPVRAWLVTMSKERGVGLHGSTFGAIPYVLGRPPVERYELLRVTTPVDIRED